MDHISYFLWLINQQAIHVELQNMIRVSQEKHGSAKARIVGVGIFDGQKRPHVGPVSMQVHVPLIDKRAGQIISMVGSNIQVMDSETFETIDVDMIDEEVEGKLQQGSDIEYWKVMDRTKIMRVKSS